MSVKERLEKQMQNSAAEQAAAKYTPTVYEPGKDEALKAANERVKAGDYATAYRTKNGALVKTRPNIADTTLPEVLK